MAVITCSVEGLGCSCWFGPGLTGELPLGVMPVDGEVGVSSLSSLLGIENAASLEGEEEFRVMTALVVRSLSVLAAAAVASSFLRFVGFSEVLDVKTESAPPRRVLTMACCLP